MAKFFLSLILLVGVCVTKSFAVSSYTTIESGVTIYSEYYPNKLAKFKGTILFENGSGTTTDEWTQNKEFLNCVMQAGSAFMYDRNGLGNSPADLNTSVANPITAQLVNDKLLKLLQANKIQPPYLIVGHSYGGLYADYFARKYPKLVHAVLLVDPAPSNFQYSEKVMRSQNIESWSKLSNVELYTKYSYANANKLHMTTSAEIYYQLLGSEKTKQQLNNLAKLSDKIPIVILSSLQMESADIVKGKWLQQQESYLNLNPDSKIITVDSGHFIQLEKPTLVCDQILKLVNLDD